MKSQIRNIRTFGLATVAAVMIIAALPAQSRSDIQVWHVRGGIYMLAGPGGNTTVQIGRDGVLVVDTHTAEVSDTLLAQIRKLSELPIRFIINTTPDADHVGGNEALKKSGQILAGGNTRPAYVYGAGGAPIFAHERALSRLAASGSPVEGWPTDSYFVRQKDMFVNGEPVQLLHQKAAHTDGDTMVMFRRTDVVSTGDVFTPDRYPMIDVNRGGSIAGLLDGINYILELAVPEFNEEGGTMIIPGHGRLCDESDVSDYRDMVTIVRDRIQALVKKKMTVDQVKAARPTKDYDGIYASPTHSADMFVEAVYRTLTK